VNVNLFESDGKTKIDFIDSGKGINKKNWKNIFKPGFSTKKRGWGLGLSLTHRIISEIHSGNIRVVTSKKGETVIRVTF
jgi:nitrogen-specific signal transduction histidine kinase